MMPLSIHNKILKIGHIYDNLIEEVHEETSSEDIFENHPRVISTENNEDVENHPHVTSTENMEDVDKLEEPIEQHIPSDPIEDIDEGPLIEDVIEGPRHCVMIETTVDLKYPQDCFNKDDHMCIPYLPQKETITKLIKIIMMRSIWCMMTLLYVILMVMRVWKVHSLVTFLKPDVLKKSIVNMRMSVSRNVMPWIRIPPYFTKVWMMIIGHTLRIPFFMYQEKGVSIWKPLEILVWKRIV